MNKILTVSLILVALLVCATIGTIALKPQMHKSVSLEQIIFKRAK